jgi:hypothetical protein
MRVRRVGRNELAVIQTMLAITDAQAEYALTPHDGSKTLGTHRSCRARPASRTASTGPPRPASHRAR